MKNEVSRKQLEAFFKLADQIDQLGQDLGPTVASLKEKNEIYKASWYWGPEDYATPAYQLHMRQNAVADLVLEALLVSAQSPKAGPIEGEQ